MSKQLFDLAIANWRRRLPHSDESILAGDALWATLYAMKVIEGRFPEAEPMVKANPMCAYKYARYVLKRRWTDEDEDQVYDNPEWSQKYQEKYERTFRVKRCSWRSIFASFEPSDGSPVGALTVRI